MKQSKWRRIKYKSILKESKQRQQRVQRVKLWQLFGDCGSCYVYPFVCNDGEKYRDKAINAFIANSKESSFYSCSKCFRILPELPNNYKEIVKFYNKLNSKHKF